ncbi:hypothetical protein CHS0354_014430 [Potamilus streckersoni]|uniref:DUSP domain-containing protein n=1 Tax=Potamilus streckersoni TaxID=2493646 RepID=A0AAE0S9P2_9BIVA|nr:hypothetical protein CHS0354_014430 [Potamilus streckersoni]
MTSAPSLSVQRRVLETLRAKRVQSSDWWEYAIAKSWYSDWKEHILYTHKKTTSNDKSEILSAHFSLLDAVDQKFMEPVYMAEVDEDNEYISESLWKIILSWFGLSSSHQLRRRPIYGGYLTLSANQHILCDRILDFLPIWICRLNELDATDEGHPTIMRVFAWDSVSYIGQQARRMLKIGNNKRCRFWLVMQENGVDIVLEPILDQRQILMSKLVENVPSVLKILEERQLEIPPYSPVLDYGEIRKPLSEVWFGDRILSIVLAVEEIGFEIGSKSEASLQTGFEVVDNDFSSIVTISSIRNQWDDVLNDYLEKYMQGAGETACTLKEDLMRSAQNIVGEKLKEIKLLRSELEIKLSYTEKKEIELTNKEADLIEKEKDLQSKLGLYKTALGEFMAKKRQLENELEKIESQNAMADTTIQLNVGGHIYQTSTVTLTKIEGSLLSMMFDGRHAIKREKDGNFFIDRDGTNFRYILNYLRDGPKAVNSFPETSQLLQELAMEAEYYELKELQDLIVLRVMFLESRGNPTHSLPTYQHMQSM